MGRRWLILVVLCLSTLVLVVDNMALNVAIPPLAEDLGASAQAIQWILDSYLLVFAGLLLTAGSLSDRYGRRRVMLIGLAVFGVASLAGAFAANPGQLIAARVGMGVGGALVMPSTLSIIVTVFDDAERRRATAVWSAVAMLGLVGGPVLGGVLVAHFWWGAVLLLNVPVAALAIVAGIVLMPESRGPARRPDPLGAVLSVVGMVALVWTIVELPRLGVTHPAVPGAFAVAVASLAAFVVHERRTESPMVPLQLFRDRNFSGGSLSLTLVQVGNGGLLLIVTQYLQFVLGYSPLQAGLAFAPMAAAVLAFNALGATLGARLGNRPMVVAGLLVMAAGFGVLVTVSPGDGFAVIGTALGVLGAGAGIAQPAAIAALMGAVPKEHAGVGSALNDTIQQAGAALGIAVLGSVLAARFTAAMPGTAPVGARTSIQDALAVATRTGDAGLARAARDAFTEATAGSFVAAIGCVLAGVVIAASLIRDRRDRPAGEAPAPYAEGAGETTTFSR